MKPDHLVVAALLIAVASPAGAGHHRIHDRYPAACSEFVDRAESARRDLKDFQRLEIEPLKKQRKRLEKQLATEEKLPPKLKKGILRLEKQVAALRAEQASLDGRDPRSTRKLEKLGLKIDRKQGKIDARREELREIVETEPTAASLRAALREVNDALADTGSLRDTKERERDFLFRALEVCDTCYRELGNCD